MVPILFSKRKKETKGQLKTTEAQKMSKTTATLAGSLWRETWMDIKGTTLASLTIVTQVAVKRWNLHRNKADCKILKTFGTAMEEHALTSILVFCEHELDLLNYINTPFSYHNCSFLKNNSKTKPPKPNQPNKKKTTRKFVFPCQMQQTFFFSVEVKV